MRRVVLAVLAAGLAVPASAQPATSTGVSATAPDPARLAAARRVTDLAMPAAGRERMIETMLDPMYENIRQSMVQSPEMTAVFGKDGKARAVFDRYMQQQFESSKRQLRAGLPAMLEAMTRAYARRLTVTELNDTAAFLATPSGQAYVKASPTIMNDPDVATWMRDYMQKAMAEMSGQIDAMMKDLGAPTKDKR